jgi:transcriptional regulator with XRE-family HTH domain
MSVNLKAERLNRGLTISEAAKQMEIPMETLRRAESGSGVHPGTAKAIADLYGYRVTDIWPVEDPVAA